MYRCSRVAQIPQIIRGPSVTPGKVHDFSWRDAHATTFAANIRSDKICKDNVHHSVHDINSVNQTVFVTLTMVTHARITIFAAWFSPLFPSFLLSFLPCFELHSTGAQVRPERRATVLHRAKSATALVRDGLRCVLGVPGPCLPLSRTTIAGEN